MTKVSVIVPVYNVEPYLARCLDSLIKQTLAYIEIICVNDCSQDNSLEILTQYAANDTRITIINHEENLKQAGARNSGLRVAIGEYVAFIDSDDYIAEDFLEKLYNLAERENVDIAKGAYRVIKSGEAVSDIISNNIEVEKNKYNFRFSLCTAIFRRSLLCKYDIKFVVDTIVFQMKAVYYANRIATTNDAIHYYCRRDDSTDSPIFSLEKWQRLNIRGAELVLDFINSVPIEKENYFLLVEKLILRLPLYGYERLAQNDISTGAEILSNILLRFHEKTKYKKELNRAFIRIRKKVEGRTKVRLPKIIKHLMWEYARKLTDRLARTDRKHKLSAFREQLAALISLRKTFIQANIDNDPNIICWLDDLLKDYKAEYRFRNVAFWIGAPQARLLLNYAEGKYKSSTQAIRQWLDSESGIYNFAGLKLPLPLNEADENLWHLLFGDIIVYHLFDSFDPMLVFRCFDESEGPYELNEQIRLRKNDVVLDCGANIGAFSALAAVKGCRVYAFEPSRHIRDTYLGKTAELNGGFVVCPYALSDFPGSFEFVVYHNNLGASRINQTGENKGAFDKTETIKAVRLDDFVVEQGIERVDFIKADIEGAERKMLKGAVDIMKKFSPRLSICTYHLPDDPEVLSDIILSAQPKYKIIQGSRKLYAYVE